MNLRPALLLSSLLALPLITLAQPPAPPPGDSGPHAGHHGPPSPERIAEHMRRELNLDDDQTARVQKQVEEFSSDMQKLHDKHEAQMKEILTPEQFAKFEQMRNERHDRSRTRTRKGPPPAPGAEPDAG